MSAPTPVSALVHSSTLVTAGVYVLIRWGPIAPGLSIVLGGARAVTFFWGGARALLSYDLKRIIAISTLSHLGLMCGTLFRGIPTLAFFHLLSHALFKSNRFLVAGMFITKFGHTQDIRLIGSAFSRSPLARGCLLLCL